MAIEPRRWGARRDDRKIAVGPSAPPMMPMEAASWAVNSPDADGGHEGNEDAELGGSPEQQRFGVGDQGAEIGHGADAEEDQGGKMPRLSPWKR